MTDDETLAWSEFIDNRPIGYVRNSTQTEPVPVVESDPMPPKEDL